MISLELWRARIGTFNNKRCSRCSLSSLSSSAAAASSSPDNCCHHGKFHTREEPAASSSVAQISSSSSSLPVIPDEQPPTDYILDHHAVSITTCSSSSSRSSPGAFVTSSSPSSSFSYFPCDQFFLHRSLLRDAVITLLIAIISQLLMVAGDIETNPGPKHGADDKPGLDDLLCMTYTGEDGRGKRFRLMSQLYPYWRRLAIALKFLPCDITVMEHKDDPVYHLLSEWLRGANQERDSRPVTWATLITALQDANVQEEADILEKHFVEIKVPVFPMETEVSGSQVHGKYFELFHHPSGGFTMRHGPIQVFVKPDVPEKLRVLLVEYADLLMILRRAKLSEANFSDLKLYLSGYCDLEPIEQCTSLRAVVDLLIKHLKVYMFNTHTLDICYKYFDDTIKHSVQKYKKHLNEFLLNTTIKNFMGTLQTEVFDRIGLESITLKLDKSRVDDTLKAFNMFLYSFFGNCSRALNHYDTGPGCVRITWIISTSLVPTLRAMAEQHTLEYLVSQGILELEIGNLQIKVSNSLMDVCEWPYQSHMQLHAFRDSLRKEFEEVKKERSIFEKKCEELQKKLRTTKEKKAAMKKQYQELQLKQLQEKLQQIEVGQWNTMTSYDIQESSSAELRSFEKFFTVLLKNIQNPVKLSARLFSADLLSTHILQAICTLEEPAQQTVKLLDTIKIQISLDPDIFYKIVNELEKDNAFTMKYLCAKLRSTCDELKSTQPVLSVTLPPNISGSSSRLHSSIPRKRLVTAHRRRSSAMDFRSSGHISPSFSSIDLISPTLTSPSGRMSPPFPSSDHKSPPLSYSADRMSPSSFSFSGHKSRSFSFSDFVRPHHTKTFSQSSSPTSLVSISPAVTPPRASFF